MDILGRTRTRTNNANARTRRIAIAVLAHIALLASAHAALQLETLWTAEAHMVMEGAPMAVDLDGDGTAEVLTAAYENLIVVDGSGKERWRFDTKGRYSTCPAILERKDAPPLIYAGDNTGQFTCIDNKGKPVWQIDMAPIFCASPALADLNGDGAIEVIQGDKSSFVNVFDALTGKPVWKTKLDGECSSAAVADLDGDGKLEIVIATGAGTVFALNAAGEIKWQYALGGASQDWATCSPIVFRNSQGQARVMCASSKQRTVCLDSNGKPVWEHPTRGAIASTLSAGDFDKDGRTDVFAVTQLGIVYRFDEDGHMLWEIDTQGRSLAPGAIIDIDGDGSYEYVLCTQSGNLLVLNGAGETIFNFQFDSRTINVTPVFADIVKDRPGLEMAITGGESGRMFCFSTPAPVDTAGQWRTYRGDNRLTGAWSATNPETGATITPTNLSADALLCGDAITLAVANPKPGKDALIAEAACVRPDGSRQSAMGKVIGASGELQLPVSYPIAGSYRFEWGLRDASGKTLASGSRALAIQPYANDQALANRAIAALKDTIAGGKAFKELLSADLAAIEKDSQALAPLQSKASEQERDDVVRRTTELNARAKRALALTKVASSAPAETQLIAFEESAWENRDIDKMMPGVTRGPLSITRRCITGEHEPVSIKLFNGSTNAVSAQCHVSAPANAPVVTPFIVKTAPTNLGINAWDPIVRLGDAKIDIPPSETREVWLDIDLASVKAGSHPITVSFDTGASKTGAKITLDVLPFEMAGYDAMRMCCWAQYNEGAVKDLLDHGNTVFITGPPAAKVEGDPSTMKLDYVALDAFVAPLKGHDAFLMLNGAPSLGVPVEDNAYDARLAEYLNQVFHHLAEHGVAEDHVAFYPFDEPGGNGWNAVHGYTVFGKKALKARPAMQIYVDGGGDLPMFQEMAEVTTIWSPSYYMLPEHSPEMDVVRKSGKTLWSYDCGYGFSRPVGANTKTINIVAQYRFAAPIAMNYGATGIGFWCYNIGPTMWDPIQYEYPLVYVNPDKTQTSSRRWEAVREGMEDARILIALKKKLADDSVSADAKAKIKHLFDITIHEYAQQAMEECRLGVARYVLDATNNEDTEKRLRDEIMDCVAAVIK